MRTFHYGSLICAVIQINLVQITILVFLLIDSQLPWAIIVERYSAILVFLTLHSLE